MTAEEIGAIIITSVLTGGLSAVTTVAALKVHVQYLRESIEQLRAADDKQAKAIERAHQRIDELVKTG